MNMSRKMLSVKLLREIKTNYQHLFDCCSLCCCYGCWRHQKLHHLMPASRTDTWLLSHANDYMDRCWQTVLTLQCNNHHSMPCGSAAAHVNSRQWRHWHHGQLQTTTNHNTAHWLNTHLSTYSARHFTSVGEFVSSLTASHLEFCLCCVYYPKKTNWLMDWLVYPIIRINRLILPTTHCTTVYLN